MSRLKKCCQNLGIIALSLVAALLVCEGVLRIYNPFHFRVRLDKIELLSNIKFRTENPSISKLDPVIIHTKNKLGFRGPQPPRDLADWLSIVAVGGSTTECFYVSDGQTWEDVLSQELQKKFRYVWVNNAGLDGQSTFGHLLLMRDYLIKLHPKCVLFLIGANDMGLAEINNYDLGRQGLDIIQPTKHISFWLAGHSEVCSLLINIYRYWEGYRRGLVHQNLVLKDQPQLEHIDKNEAQKIIHRYQGGLALFAQRLAALVALAKENGITPVLITQPALFGDAIDKVTGVNLGTIKMDQEVNGELKWKILERFNDITRQTAQKDHLLLIDLAREMPKDSRYYYDYFHFTNAGCIKVGEIIAKGLAPWLAATFPKYNNNLASRFQDGR